MKVTKKEAKFESPAKGMDHCRSCIFFKSPHNCEKVLGKVSPGDWCKFFKKKK